MCLVPPSDDPWLVGWRSRPVGRNSVEPSHHPSAFVRKRWRNVSFVGMAGSDRKSLVLISHEAWIGARWWMCCADPRCSRCRTAPSGFEPLRIEIMPRHDQVVLPIVAPPIGEIRTGAEGLLVSNPCVCRRHDRTVGQADGDRRPGGAVTGEAGLSAQISKKFVSRSLQVEWPVDDPAAQGLLLPRLADQQDRSGFRDFVFDLHPAVLVARGDNRRTPIP
jgi:hypothetical protein